jgi:valyl-tRNA synthetase
VYEENAGTIGRLARARVSVSSGAAPESAAHILLRGGSEVVVPLAGLIDVDKECQRLRGELEALEKQIISREQRLANPKYVERAPEHVVRSDRATLEEMVSKRGQLTEKVRALCGT